MVVSYATLHRQSVEAAKTASTSQVIRSAANNTSKLLMAALAVDKARLQQLRSLQARAALKRDLFPKYADYLTSLMQQQSTGHHEGFVLLCIWALDAGLLTSFITLAEYALKHGMRAPEGFKRTLPEVLLEEISEQVLRVRNPSDWRDYIQHLHELTQGADIADEVTAKSYKALGVALESTDLKAALEAYQTAHQYGAAVKRLINNVSKRLLA